MHVQGVGRFAAAAAACVVVGGSLALGVASADAATTSVPVTLTAASLSAQGFTCVGVVTYVAADGTTTNALEYDVAGATLTGAKLAIGGTPTMSWASGAAASATSLVIYATSIDATVGGTAFHDDATAATHACPVASGGDVVLTGLTVTAVDLTAAKLDAPSLDVSAG